MTNIWCQIFSLPVEPVGNSTWLPNDSFLILPIAPASSSKDADWSGCSLTGGKQVRLELVKRELRLEVFAFLKFAEETNLHSS